MYDIVSRGSFVLQSTSDDVSDGSGVYTGDGAVTPGPHTSCPSRY